MFNVTFDLSCEEFYEIFHNIKEVLKQVTSSFKYVKDKERVVAGPSNELQ